MTAPGRGQVGWALARWTGYALLLFAVHELVLLEARSGHYDRFFETHFTEIASASLLLLMALWLYASRLWQSPPAVLTDCAAGVFLMMCIRELDWHLEQWFGGHAWKVGVLIVLGLTLVRLLRHRRIFMEQLRSFATTPAFGVLAAGGVWLLVHARQYGREALWTAVAGEDYERVIKTVNEEVTELGAYLVLLFGCIEWLLQLWRTRRTHAA